MRMRVLGPLLVVSLSGIAVVAAPPIAGATVTPTVVGTEIHVTMTGESYLGFGCGVVNINVNGTPLSPALPCAQLTKVVVTGDDGRQIVYGDYLDDPLYSAGPTIQATLNGGNDLLIDTKRSDSINLGAGNDALQLNPTSANSSANLGADFDTVYVVGTDASETYTATSGSANVAIAYTQGAANATTQAQNAEDLSIDALGGNDTITTTAINAASTIVSIEQCGRAGNDTLTNANVSSNQYGGTGTNTMTSGTGDDHFYSESETDTVHDSGGYGWVHDVTNPRSGGRTIDVTGSGSTSWDPDQSGGDSVIRFRPTGAANAWLMATMSLNRPGQQIVPDPISLAFVSLSANDTGSDRSLVDIAPGTAAGGITAYGDAADDDIADITVDSGTWHETGTAQTSLIIDPDEPGLPDTTVTNMGAVSIHNPWVDKNSGFVHRQTRDLLFRFLTEGQVTSASAQLTAGTKTRPQLTSAIIGTDEYRGLDVDRVYTKYLRRTADPGGRTSWISALRNGKPLWRFRAQLIGSNEYFTKAGSTNAKYMIRAYNDVMGRLPDPSGQTFWTNKLDHGANRGSVALQFLASPEARRNIVKDQFLRFLDRLPTSTESTTWVNNLGSSPSGEQDLIAFLVNSNAYYGRS